MRRWREREGRGGRGREKAGRREERGGEGEGRQEERESERGRRKRRVLWARLVQEVYHVTVSVPEP